MKKPIGMEDYSKQEVDKRRNFTFRINVFFFVSFFLFSVLIVRLAMLQFVEGKQLLAEKVDINKADTPIPPIRGNIFDRMGVPLASTTSTQSLYFRIEDQQEQKEVIQLAHRLADIFGKFGTTEKVLTADDIMKEMDIGYDLNTNKVKISNAFSSPRRIKAELNQKEVAYLLEHRDEMKWIEIMEESVRTYDPVDPVAVQVVGYMRPFAGARNPDSGIEFYKNKENTTGYIDTEYVGYDGIELMYQKELRGESGYKTYPINRLNKIVGQVELTKPTKGNNLHLTIDKNIQTITEQAILERLKYLKSAEARANPYIAKGKNAVAGFAVAMEVKTGKVVTMASMPDYDPNVWAGTLTQEKYDAIKPFVNNGTITTAPPNYPTEAERNRHPSSIVYMGSVIKPLTVLVGLNERLFTVGERYNDTGVFFFGKNDSSKHTNSDSRAWGSITATQAIQYSSNTFMSAMIGNPLFRRNGDKAIDIWDQYLAKFGLGVLTGSGLKNEYAGLSEYKTNKKESVQSRMIFASWGQNEKTTTLQLAQYAATLASRGERIKPQLIDRIETYDGKLVKQYKEEDKVVLDKTEFPAEYWNAVIEGMKRVGVQGFDDFPYTFARKTGTSTQDVPGGRVDNGVFIAFAPVENPTLAVAVVVPEGGFGSYSAAPIARKIFDAYDQYYGLDGVPKGAPAGQAASGAPKQ